MFTVVGQTQDGMYVVSGVFRFYETHGLPLDVIFELLRNRNSVPCWITMCLEAAESGMKFDHILSKIEGALSDVYGAPFRDQVVSSLQMLYDGKKHCPSLYYLRPSSPARCAVCKTTNDSSTLS